MVINPLVHTQKKLFHFHGQSPGKVAQQATSMLYAGEHFDTDSQNYYLRARWYDSLSGRFNRMDPFAGNNRDPQSLHKYLYAYCNPINSIDPTGNMEFSIVGLTVNINNQMLVRTINLGRRYWQYKKVRNALKAMAVAGVISSAVMTTFIDGKASLELPFNRTPLLSDWPDLTFSWSWKYGGDRKIAIKAERPIAKAAESLFSSSDPPAKAFDVEINLTHPALSTWAFSGSGSKLIYKKTPIKATLDAAGEIGGGFGLSMPNPAFTLGIGLKFDTGWDPLSFGTSFSLFKADRSGVSLLWGAPMKY